jgi:hypothetical protein
VKKKLSLFLNKKFAKRTPRPLVSLIFDIVWSPDGAAIFLDGDSMLCAIKRDTWGKTTLINAVSHKNEMTTIWLNDIVFATADLDKVTEIWDSRNISFVTSINTRCNMISTNITKR